MQTLFNDSRVFYVVAADRRWLYVCFETSYKEFADHILEPGRRLGYLFLEKAFQLSVSVPPVSNEAQAAYLDYLLRGEQSNVEQALEAERQAARQEFANVQNEEEAINKLQTPPQAPTKTAVEEPLRRLVRKEAAIRQLASQEVDKSTQVFLQPFAPLLERNPRAMKRLVNAYGIYRALALLDDVTLVSDIAKRKQLALWTIVSLRWPSLAEYLERYPKTVEALRKPRGKLDDLKLIKELELLVETSLDDVQRVLNGKAEGVNVQLDEAAILRLIGIKASHSLPAVVA
jgi:hypothetical protein